MRLRRRRMLRLQPQRLRPERLRRRLRSRLWCRLRLGGWSVLRQQRQRRDMFMCMCMCMCMCMLHGMYHAYTMHIPGSDSVTLETSEPTATAGAWEWRLVMQCAASLPDVEAEAHPPSGSALLARVRVSSRDSAAQVPPMLLRLDLPKLVIALGTEGVDAAVTAAAAATTAAGAAGRAAWRGCSRLQEGTLLRVSLQAARHRLAFYDRARGWEACSVGRLSAEVLYICITRRTCSLVITPPCSPPA